jgi:chaperonin GroES
MQIKFKPIKDKIIVERILEEEKIGSIYLPENMREEKYIGKVLAVGPGLDCHRHNQVANGGLEIKVGDTVVINKFTGLNFRLKGKKFLSVSAREVFAVLES